MLNRIYDWIDDRIDITPIWRDVADHEVPEHVNPAYHFSAFVYCFGGLTFFITVIQILSGMFLTMYYVPDIINANPAKGNYYPCLGDEETEDQKGKGACPTLHSLQVVGL